MLTQASSHSNLNRFLNTWENVIIAQKKTQFPALNVPKLEKALEELLIANKEVTKETPTPYALRKRCAILDQTKILGFATLSALGAFLMESFIVTTSPAYTMKSVAVIALLVFSGISAAWAGMHLYSLDKTILQKMFSETRKEITKAKNSETKNFYLQLLDTAERDGIIVLNMISMHAEDKSKRILLTSEAIQLSSVSIKTIYQEFLKDIGKKEQ